ncbi:MAG: flagellar hook-basal body complex protein FliE [Steroidobacteraceae bacterium]|nr:flagellar hook-basal body complex protein FliE [Steroidobacteraceae bacterium]MCW5573843.1 flagellar hook-basal body complex protein FliE [Steroidobacteraceae bacterium]
MSQLAIEQVLAQIRALSSQATKPQAARPQAPGAATEAGGFAALMKQGVEQVNAAQQRAADVATQFQQGVPGVELPQVMLELQKASVSFRAATEVRNRLVNVYQEIMNMPI